MSHAKDNRLLLLPRPPSEISFATFRAAYEPALKEVLARCSDFAGGVCLDVALSCPGVPLYPQAQHLVGLLYRLLLCAEVSLEIKAGCEVDYRVFLLGGRSDITQGPIINLESLARSERRWSQIYTVESEGGESLLKRMIQLRQSIPQRSHARDFTNVRVARGTSASTAEELDTQELQPSKEQKHHSVAVGGTFDHLHIGHKLLLTATALLLETSKDSDQPRKNYLTVGITGDELLKNKKFAKYMQSWDERQNAAYEFLLGIISFGDPDQATRRVSRFFDEGPNGKAIHYELQSGLTVICVEISDPFGPTITDESITALVVSGETRSGGRAVNEKRTAKGWPPLQVYEVDVLEPSYDDKESSNLGADFKGKISSTDIRRGLHDRDSSRK